jgi:two-component system sensor histidine kinase ResE
MMSDVIIYFGPVEFILFAFFLIILSSLMIGRYLRQQYKKEMQQLIDGFAFPAMLFRGNRPFQLNDEAQDWKSKLEIAGVIQDSIREDKNIIRTIPVVEGQSYQVRTIRLTKRDTLVLLEDLAIVQRQHAFYRTFIQNVSHEIKTPLTVIQGHAAKMGDAPEDREGWLASQRIISDETRRLTKLVDNLLTLSHLESSSFSLEYKLMNFGALLEECILQVSEMAEERQLSLSLNQASGLPRISVDRPRMKQVILNLLDNAIKYTPIGGEITVDVRADEENEQLLCSVRDTGEGIPEEDLPYIFEKLYRAKRTKRRPVEGSGLGLTLAQQIIQAHQGVISVQSKLNEGSVFTFTLPYEAHDG